MEYPEVSSALGKVRGTYQKSYHGRVFSAFEGVPYAKPPTGSLRFEVSKNCIEYSGKVLFWYFIS